MCAKRSAGINRKQDNWKKKEEDEQAKIFPKATKKELNKRVLLKANRNNTQTEAYTESKRLGQEKEQNSISNCDSEENIEMLTEYFDKTAITKLPSKNGFQNKFNSINNPNSDPDSIPCCSKHSKLARLKINLDEAVNEMQDCEIVDNEENQKKPATVSTRESFSDSYKCTENWFNIKNVNNIVNDENSIYISRCMYRAREEMMIVLQGTGTLLIIPITELDKTQHIIRAYNEQKQLQINVIVNDSVDVQRLGQYDILLIWRDPMNSILLMMQSRQRASALWDIIGRFIQKE